MKNARGGDDKAGGKKMPRVRKPKVKMRTRDDALQRLGDRRAKLNNEIPQVPKAEHPTHCVEGGGKGQGQSQKTPKGKDPTKEHP